MNITVPVTLLFMVMNLLILGYLWWRYRHGVYRHPYNWVLLILTVVQVASLLRFLFGTIRGK